MNKLAMIKAVMAELDKIAMNSNKWMDAKHLAYLKGALHEIFLRSRQF